MFTILATIIILCLYGLVAFPVAVVFSKAWEAIAWHFNLPLFGYWQMYFITWALLILKPSGNSNSNNKTNSDTNIKSLIE
jgi:hypothetical protein